MDRSDGEHPLPLTLQSDRFRWSASWPMTLLTCAAVVLFVGLGRWQWQRAERSRTLTQQFALLAASPLALGNRSIGSLPRYSTVRVQGRYDVQHQFLLENISHDGEPGYDVLTPLRLDDGRALIVNRGWIPLTVSRAQLPHVLFEPPASLWLTGRLDNLPVPGISLGRAAPSPGAQWPKLTSFPTMQDLATALHTPLEPRQLLLGAREPFGYARDWHPGGLTADRHVSYAVQWWAFAALALVLFVMLNRKPKHQ
jgi:surfeit locus 1 family protein